MFTAPANYLALLAAAVAAFLIGTAWYSPLLFGNLWLKEQGFTDAQKKEMATSMYITMAGSFLGYLVTAYTLSFLFGKMGITDAPQALSLGVLLWLGFPAAIGLMNSLYSGKSLTVYLIDTTYQFVYIEVMALILALWR